MAGSLITERRISGRAFLGHYLAATIAAFAIGTALLLSGQGVLLPLALLPLAGVAGYAHLVRLGASYRLYPDRLEVESGVVSRRIENVELFRIRDVGLQQGVLGRMGNFGDVYIHSTDSSAPDLHVRAIEAPQEFYQQLRDLVTDSRARSRTMIVEETPTFSES